MSGQSLISRVLASIIVCVTAIPPAAGAGPIWAKAASPLPTGCGDSQDVQTLRSPDKATSLEVRCAGSNPAGTGVTLRVASRGRWLDVAIRLDEGSSWRPQEVLWAPDSSAFLINGSESAYAGDGFVLYEIATAEPTTRRITAAVQKDMVKAFPPCRAAHLEAEDCRRIAGHPQFNMSAIGWTRNSRAVIVFAEVPCSGTFGGIMCQAMGYEIDVASGRILARMTAIEFKRRYQPQAAWDIRTPEEPTFKR